MGNKNKQSGIALITILIILSIMVTIASTMTARMTASLLRTEGLDYSQKIYWYGQAMVDFTRKVLNDDFSDSDIVSLDQIWATPDLIFPVDNGTLSGNIVDARSCFNLNALAAEDNDAKTLGIMQLESLLIALDVEEFSAEVISESVRDWIDSNDTVDGSQGAEDRYYESLNVPHLTANKLMVDVSELRSVQGVTAEIYDRVDDYLCALPVADQLININTVKVDKAEVLFALFPSELQISLEELEQLIEDRPVSGWISVDEFLTSEYFGEKLIPDIIRKQLSVSSDFFQLYGVAEFEDRIMALKLLFKIENKKATTIRFQFAGVD